MKQQTPEFPKGSLTFEKIDKYLNEFDENCNPQFIAILWSHDGYYLHKSDDGQIYVTCAENGFTSPFEKEDVTECYSYGFA
jgi:hypothetical protein